MAKKNNNSEKIDSIKERKRYTGNGIRAIHINWTLPFRYRNPGQKYTIPDYEVLSTALSAFLWRLLNGSIKLYTDAQGLEFYSQCDMLGLWDGGVDYQVLSSIEPQHINPEIFWAAGKLFAIQNEKKPFVMMDTDLMVWRNLADSEYIYNRRLMALHREPLANNDYYLPLYLLKKRSDYTPNPKWDWSEDPCNTALAYFNDTDFLNRYTSAAIDFMTDNNERPMEMVTQMVFAEQRIFSMVAKESNIPIGTFLDNPDQENGITHIWGAKAEAQNDPTKLNSLCKELSWAIFINFPEYRQMPYLRGVMKKYCPPAGL